MATISLDFSTTPVKELKEEAISLYCSIYQAECFNVRDLRIYEAVIAELQNRGYEVEESSSLSISK